METNAGKCHVLIVDDNLELADTFKQLLEAHGYDVTVAANGVLALKHILHKPVDAIVCDLKMPQLEGDMFYITVERVKPELCLRFVFITGMGSDPKFQTFINRVQSPVLFKPVETTVLLREIEKVIRR